MSLSMSLIEADIITAKQFDTDAVKCELFITGFCLAGSYMDKIL